MNTRTASVPSGAQPTDSVADPRVTTESAGFWEWVGRGANLIAVIVGFLALFLAWRAYRLQEQGEQRHRRGQAAFVLNLGDLINRRIEHLWRAHVGRAHEWPAEQTLEYWAKEIDQDVGFAGTMQDRAASIDLVTAVSAEAVWQRLFFARQQIQMIKVDWHNSVRGRDNLPRQIREQWSEHRGELLATFETAAAALAELDALFETEVRTIDAISRAEYVRELNERTKRNGAEKARDILKKFDDEHRAILQAAEAEQADAQS
jgi:hypothetical protein